MSRVSVTVHDVLLAVIAAILFWAKIKGWG